jgi:septal ring factor EnvC (AmiA/AmiB activator)
LTRVRREENTLGGQLAELKERANRLSALIKKLESAKPREYTPLTGDFAARKGFLPWPVNGRVRVGFGTSRHPEAGTLHDSQGIEIEAADEQPIAAIWSGQVIFADYFKGFGKMLILDHGNGYYTLYAQAARLTRKLGDKIAGGTVLAHAGAEGVYFEVRHHGVPLNPENWLSAR